MLLQPAKVSRLHCRRLGFDQRRSEKREPLGIELISPAVFEQKLNYIHYNRVRAGLCINAEDYYYSSARFYYEGVDSFRMLTHYSGN